MSIRKYQRSMARKRLEQEGYQHLNKMFRSKGAPAGKVGRNSRFSTRSSTSAFAREWRSALGRVGKKPATTKRRAAK